MEVAGTLGKDLLIQRFRDVRAASERLAAPLSSEDCQLQSMPDASPVKWHLAHMIWFFEAFLLTPHLAGYRPLDAAYAVLFNSYYVGVGEQHPRARRGMVSRPSLVEVHAYRRHVDAAMERLIPYRCIPGGWRRKTALFCASVTRRELMDSLLDGWPHEVTPQGVRLTACTPHDLLTRLGDKWTILVLSLLSVAPDHRLRFSQIKYGVQGISQRMLTRTLRHLERDGLLLRHYHAEVPPRVEYELTDIGQSMQEPLRIFAGWIRDNWPAIDEARRDFDGDHCGAIGESDADRGKPREKII
jgi:DNA-binding HxlR family transcriptional regulator